MSNYSIKNNMQYLHYNINEAIQATYGHPIRLSEYPEVLKLARKLGIVISTEEPWGRMFTYICKLQLSRQILVCYFNKPMGLDTFHSNVEKLFQLMAKSRPDVLRARDPWIN